MGANAFTFRIGYKGTLDERLANKTMRRGPDECWPWIGSKSTSGYGMIRVDGHIRHATRVVWQLHHGVIPDGMMLVMHRCDNPPCVNPAHLLLGDARENAADKYRKGRGRNYVGADHPQTKLTASQRGEARALRASGARVKDIAARLGVHVDTVSRVLNGRARRSY